MLRTCGKRLMVADGGRRGAGVARGRAGRCATSQKAAFARIAVSEKSVVYIQIQGNELRAAIERRGIAGRRAGQDARAAAPTR